MVFTYSSNREDLPGGKLLTSIQVLDHLGSQVNRISFQYGYFGSGSSLCKRLRLNSISDLGSLPLYVFSYNQSVNLPCRDSKSVDYLGLYNNYTGADWIPASIENIISGPRRPDATRMKANLITRIDYRGGGYSLFDFEPHSGVVKYGTTYINGHAYPIVENQLISVLSGNRILKIRNYDGTGAVSVVDYKYEKTEIQNGQQVTVSSGEINRYPLFKLNLNQLVRWFSHNQAELMDANGVFVGYTRVTETVDLKGQTEYIFSSTVSSQILSTELPLTFFSTKFWERGLLMSAKSFLQGNLTTPLTSTVYEYNLTLPNNRVISGKEKIVVPSEIGTNNIQSKEYNYTLVSKPIILSQKTTTYHDQDVNTKTHTSVEQYAYQTPTYQLSTLTSWNSTNPNEKLIQTTKYITHPDYNYSTSNCESQLAVCLNSCTNGASTCENNCYIIYNNCTTQALNTMGSEGKAIIKMREYHMNNAVIESQSFIQRSGINYLIGAELNKFSYSGGYIFPQSQWVSRKNTATNYTGSRINTSGVFEMSSLFVEVSNQTYSGTNGRLTSQSNRDGMRTDFTYSNNNMTVASQTVNPNDNPFSSSFLFKPLVGVTKETDINGKAVNMEYDGLGRVRLIKDNGNNIRERIRYHSKNETPNFRISAPNSQISAGNSVTFSLVDILLPSGGTTTRHWSTGTGTTYTDNRQTMTHTYTTPGLYIISSTLFTNEFNSVTRSFNLLVTGPLQISICANGPQDKDLCNPNSTNWGTCTSTQVDSGSTRFQSSFFPANNTGCTGLYSYQFEYRLAGGNWISFGNGFDNFADFIHNSVAPGYYYIRCTVTDSCSNTAVSESYINIYRSNPSCATIDF